LNNQIKKIEEEMKQFKMWDTFEIFILEKFFIN
jgi:hypothetical protein